ncbi:hypothetical protein [Actinoplanes sp. HUAS TT8]|uniref:hypothetical protein n=1 Tax=Actinoplanes sp. HUAS TT8 TaxID=3447453 RepID=UPI003F527C59
MSTKLRRGLLAGAIAIGFTLSGASAASAATTAASTGLTGTATELVYGQPDLDGFRWGNNTITLTNHTSKTIEFPQVSFPGTGPDQLIHTMFDGCKYMQGGLERITCITDPLAAGASLTLTVPWATPQSGPARTVTVKVNQAANSDGTPIAGTGSKVSWKAKFEKLTGTFSIKASQLTFGDRDAAGLRHGSTKVTIKNLTTGTIQYPALTIGAGAGDVNLADWTGCLSATYQDYKYVCTVAPLAAGAKNTVELPFSTPQGAPWDYSIGVRVDALDASGAVIDGTAAGTQFVVSSPGDAE